MYRVILASGSPRRKELLAQIGIEFEVLTSDVEEHSKFTAPAELVKDLASQKAEAVCEKYRDYFNKVTEREGKKKTDDVVIIGADTIVAMGEQILGKPKDEQDAYSMLSELQGNRHQVYTGVCLLLIKKDGTQKKLSFAEMTQVSICPMSAEEIRCYISSGDPMDKAGSYGIQGRFARHIEGIEGDYYNVVGLPVCRLYQELKQILPV